MHRLNGCGNQQLQEQMMMMRPLKLQLSRIQIHTGLWET